MRYWLPTAALWFIIGWILGGCLEQLVCIWRERPAVIYDDYYGRWRSARLVRKEQAWRTRQD